MKSTGKFSDQRVKKGLFPLSTFVLFFLLFALLTTLQMVMIGQAIDYKSLPAKNVIAVVVFILLRVTRQKKAVGGVKGKRSAKQMKSTKSSGKAVTPKADKKVKV